jgi:hypothetical protein
MFATYHSPTASSSSALHIAGLHPGHHLSTTVAREGKSGLLGRNKASWACIKLRYGEDAVELPWMAPGDGVREERGREGWLRYGEGERLFRLEVSIAKLSQPTKVSCVA